MHCAHPAWQFLTDKPAFFKSKPKLCQQPLGWDQIGSFSLTQHSPTAFKWFGCGMPCFYYIKSWGKRKKKKEKELIICIHCVTDRSLPGAGLGDLWWGALWGISEGRTAEPLQKRTSMAHVGSRSGCHKGVPPPPVGTESCSSPCNSCCPQAWQAASTQGKGTEKLFWMLNKQKTSVPAFLGHNQQRRQNLLKTSSWLLGLEGHLGAFITWGRTTAWIDGALQQVKACRSVRVSQWRNVTSEHFRTQQKLHP